MSYKLSCLFEIFDVSSCQVRILKICYMGGDIDFLEEERVHRRWGLGQNLSWNRQEKPTKNRSLENKQEMPKRKERTKQAGSMA